MTRTAEKQVSRKSKRVVHSASRRPVTRPTAKPTGIRNYRQAIEFLNCRTDFEKMVRVGYNHTNFNLSRMLRILAGLGNPHKHIRTAHIAGTKGKGSTCHMLSAMLQQAGYKTGLYVSPHIVDLRERISINGEMIPEATFARLIGQIAPVVNRLKGDDPTFFEVMTAAALLYFHQKKTDIAVIETGLGGRLDATNVLKPEVCGITSISYDHVQQLGNTLEKIATEKAGIFKPGVPVVVAPQVPSVRKVFKKMAEQVGAPLKVLGEDLEFSYRFECSRATGPHTRVCVSSPAGRFDHIRVPLLGEHQAHNCGVALGMFEALREAGFTVAEQHAIDGLAKVQVKGRLELIKDNPRTIVDCAHNASSVSALMRAIGQNITYDSMVVIFGCSADKDIDGMLDQVQLGADKVIFTNTGVARAADPQELYLRFAEKCQKMAQVAPRLEDAYEIAKRCVGRDDLICITGSVYLVGLAKKLLAEGRLA